MHYVYGYTLTQSENFQVVVLGSASTLNDAEERAMAHFHQDQHNRIHNLWIKEFDPAAGICISRHRHKIDTSRNVLVDTWIKY